MQIQSFSYIKLRLDSSLSVHASLKLLNPSVIDHLEQPFQESVVGLKYQWTVWNNEALEKDQRVPQG